MTTTARKCPKCKSGYLDTRVSRGFLFKLLFSNLPYKRYRCDSCFKKSYIKNSDSVIKTQQ